MKRLGLVCLASLSLWLCAVCAALALKPGTIPLRMSYTEPGNLLPAFLFLQGSEEGGSTRIPLGGGLGTRTPWIPSDKCPDEFWDGVMEDTRSPQLPYLRQDLWGCEREETAVPCLDIENDRMFIKMVPQWGGKMWKIYDKTTGTDVVFDNPAHQPANIGALGSWTSGGWEFNWSPGIIGHSVFTESPVWVASIDTEHGPVTRVYEFDRYNGTVWQTDILLDPDVNAIWTHTKITNPTPTDLKGYWWTCVANRATPGTRIIAPGEGVVETDSVSQMRYAPWPEFHQADNVTGPGIPDDLSYIGNIIDGDFFIQVAESERPFIAHASEDGTAIVHVHPLKGTKFFTWGQNGPGRFMQDFLSARTDDSLPRFGDYTELQVGVAPTQMQAWNLPANSTREWTEVIRVAKFDPADLHGEYDVAVNTVKKWMAAASGLPQTRFDEMDKFMAFIADQQLTEAEIVARGMPWGALNEELLNHKMATGTLFIPDVDDADSKMWWELLHLGTFSNDTLETLAPLSYQVSEIWQSKIEESCQTSNCSWLHYLLLAVAKVEMGETARPLELLQMSMNLKPNPVAARVMGVLQPNAAAADPLFKQAWKLTVDAAPGITRLRLMRNLATEICFLYQSYQLWDELRAFIAALPAECVNLDAVQTSKVKLGIIDGSYDASLQILASSCFPTYASNRRDLQIDWYRAIEGREQARLGRPMTPIEAKHVRQKNPSPRNVGCQYGAHMCLHDEYW